jgi:uncharacterized protein
MQTTPFRPPFWQWNGHLQTIIPSLARRIQGVDYQRERIETPDGDFLDLDWYPAVQKSTKRNPLILLTHGLEGHTRSTYILGMARYFHDRNWDVLAWNCRSCSGEMNRAFRMYHHGDTDDIDWVVQHILKRGYTDMALCGFSMGASISLKYLGTRGDTTPSAIRGAVVFSAPCDISAGADVLDRWDNWLYKTKFLRALGQKIKEKALKFPGRLDVSKLSAVRRWRDFDEWFSAPICGYGSAEEFHRQASSKNYLAGIRVPTLLVSAANDPILTPACWPFEAAKGHPYFQFQLTQFGGHCGFQSRAHKDAAWSEIRTFEFISAQPTRVK